MPKTHTSLYFKFLVCSQFSAYSSPFSRHMGIFHYHLNHFKDCFMMWIIKVIQPLILSVNCKYGIAIP